MKPEGCSYIEAVEPGHFKSAKAKVTQKIIDLMKAKINDENAFVPSASLFDQCDADAVPMIHEVSKVPCNDVNLTHNGPSILSKNPVSDQHFANQIVALQLQEIALEPCEGGCSRHHFEKKRRAFEHLKSCATNLPSDFYQAYYMTIKDLLNYNNSEHSAIRKLDQYMASREKADKYRILRALTVCLSESAGRVKLSIFNDFHPIAWGRELLLYALLGNNSTWNAKQASKLAKETSNLDAFMKKNTTSHCVEDILEILIKSQNTHQLDIGFIIKVVKLLRCNVQSLDVIFRVTDSLPSIIDDLEILRLKTICDRQRIICTEEKHLVELHNLLSYSEETIDSTLAKVKRNTEITELIDFFKTLQNNDLISKENFLRQLTPYKNIDIWKKELYFPLIQTFILREFPLCHLWFPELGTFDTQKATDLSGFESSKYLEFLNKLTLAKNKDCTSYCECNVSRQEELKMSLNDSSNGLLIAQMFHDLNFKLAKLMVKCGWSDKTLTIIKKWIKCLDQELKVAELVGSLDILVDYDMDITECKLSNLISRATLANVQKEVHNFVINDAFPGTREKKVNDLIMELMESNINEGIPLLENRNLLREKYDKVMEAYDGPSQLSSSDKKIKNWSESDIEAWSKPFAINRVLNIWKVPDPLRPVPPELLAVLTLVERHHISDIVKSISEYEIIAVLKRTMQLVSKLQLRDIQLLSVILLVSTEENKGRLAQINTGEGKTTIIAMIAAYHALRGNKVDIITSSELLAIPQSKEQAKFYETLILKNGHNFDNSGSYMCDIVYGTSQQFQGHILRDEFRKEGIRHGRKCDVAIVDEVDNMLVDGNDHIVMLSKNMPAMDHLEPILSAIFTQVKAAAASLISKNGKIYFVNPENAVDETGEFKKEIVENYEEISCTAREFIESATDRHIRALIRDGDTSSLPKGFPEIKIPKHLRKFICQTHLKNWINSAINAQFFSKEDGDYIIIGNEVKVVDVDNTGVVEYDMSWSNGLHQFLELRHGARLTPERLTSNFISNVTFFKRYRPKIYGLSGTLGCKATKRLLKETYDVDTVIVPPFMLKQHKELAAIIVDNHEDWYRSIAKSSLQKLKNGRAVLVIMENIGATIALENTFKNEFFYDKDKIKMYKTDKDSGVLDKPLKSGDIIITTNIAGRGTDIKLSEGVDKNGGLHVCVTFLPKNSRVEDQNIGRTARTGNRGTSQFILLNSENDIRELRNKREQEEDEAIKNARTVIAQVTTNDMIFQKFCRLLDDIEGRSEFSRDIEKNAVEERFAIWMKMNNDRISKAPRDEVLKDFESFKKEIMDDDSNDSDNNLIRNPYMYVKIGNKYLENKNYIDAIREYSSAIKLDKNFAEHARYNRGFCYIAQYGDDVSGNEHFINKAVNDLKKARSLIEERERGLHLEQHASDGEVFLLKIKNKLNLYLLQKNAIDMAIGPDYIAIDAQIEKLEKDKESDKLTSEQKKEIKKAIKDLKKLKEVDGVIQSARSKGRDLKIECRKLKESLPDDDKSHDKEIEEFEENGAIGSFEISEIPPIDWNAVICLLAIGFAQLIVGAALTVFTLGGGASFGMSLMVEGISDIITAVKDGIINRSFDWATWAIEKAISLTVAVVCAGYKAMKDVVKTGYAAAKTACTNVATEATKEGWRIVAKKLGWELAKGIGKQVATELVNYGLNKTLIPSIRSAIINRIREPIEKALLENPEVKIMLELDEKNNNRYYENRIKAIGLALLRQENNTDLVYIIARIGSGIADKKVERYTDTRQIATAIYGLYELVTFTHKFIGKLNDAIYQEAVNDKIYEKLSGKPVTKIEPKVKKPPQNNTSQPSGADVDLNRINDDHEQVKLKKQKKRDPSNIAAYLTEAAANSMVDIVKQKMLNPLIERGVNYTAKKFTAGRDLALDETMKTYRSYKRVIHYQNKISSRRENEHVENRERSTEEQFAMSKAREMIQDAREGGPSGLVHLGAISKAVGRPIALRDENGTLLCVIGGTKEGQPVEVEYHKPENGGTVGHYTLPGGLEPPNRTPGSNLGIYSVIGYQTGRDSEELKDSSLTIMENNVDKIAESVNDITHLQMYEELKLAMGETGSIDE